MKARVKGPNGFVFAFPEDVARTLVASPGGEYVYVTDEAPTPEATPEPKPAPEPKKKRAPRKAAPKK